MARVAHHDHLRILAIGSSSTEGVGATARDRSYPARLEALLRSSWPGLEATVENAGIGGEVADQTIARLKGLLVSGRFDLVIWQVGTNDAVRGGDLAQFERMVSEGIDAARGAGVPVLVMDPQYFPGIQDAGRYGRYVSTIAAIARSKGVAVLPRFEMMTRWSRDYPAGFRETLAADGFHMSDVGYDCLARDAVGAVAAVLGLPKPAAALTASAGR